MININITGSSNDYALKALEAHNRHARHARDFVAQLSTGSALIKDSSPATAAIINSIDSNLDVYRQAEISTLNSPSSFLADFTGDDDPQFVVELVSQLSQVAVQASTGGQDSATLAKIDETFQQLLSQLDNYVTRTRWNGTSLLLEGDDIAASVTPNSATNVVDDNNIIDGYRQAEINTQKGSFIFQKDF